MLVAALAAWCIAAPDPRRVRKEEADAWLRGASQMNSADAHARYFDIDGMVACAQAFCPPLPAYVMAQFTSVERRRLVQLVTRHMRGAELQRRRFSSRGRELLIRCHDGRYWRVLLKRHRGGRIVCVDWMDLLSGSGSRSGDGSGPGCFADRCGNGSACRKSLARIRIARANSP